MEEKEKLLDARKRQKKAKPLFVRKDSFKISRLGRNRKNKQKWRRPRGRHNKVREKKKGNVPQPSMGYRSPKQVRGLVNGLKIVYISNVHQLIAMKKDELGVIRNVGGKKKLELMKKAKELNVKLYRTNAEKEISKIENKISEKKKIREERIKKKLERQEKEKLKKEKKEEKKTEEKEDLKKEKEKTLHQKTEEKQHIQHDDLEQSHSHEIKHEHVNIKNEGRGLENAQSRS